MVATPYFPGLSCLLLSPILTPLLTHSHVGHDSFTCGTWLIHIWDMTHLHTASPHSVIDAHCKNAGQSGRLLVCCASWPRSTRFTRRSISRWRGRWGRWGLEFNQHSSNGEELCSRNGQLSLSATPYSLSLCDSPLSGWKWAISLLVSYIYLYKGTYLGV